MATQFCRLSNATLRSSIPTSTPSAFDVFYTSALYKFTVIIAANAANT